MSTDRLFKQFEPPPGGVERFAHRLDATAAGAPGPQRRHTFALAGAACAAVALVVAVVLLREPSESMSPSVADSPPTPEIYDSPAFDRLLGRPLQAAELTATLNEQPASVTAVATQNDKVRIYRIN